MRFEPCSPQPSHPYRPFSAAFCCLVSLAWRTDRQAGANQLHLRRPRPPHPPQLHLYGNRHGRQPRDHPGRLRLRQLRHLLRGEAVLGDGQEGPDRSLKDRLQALRRPRAGGGKHPDHRRDRLHPPLRLRPRRQPHLPDLPLRKGGRLPL